MSDHRPYRKWYMHRRDALRRGIPFELTFEDWIQIWLDSGHWHERGKRTGQYVMARPNDEGPYVKGNVKIVTQADNTREACLGKKQSPEHVANAAATRIGRKRSPETIAKIRETNIRTYQSSELRKRVVAARVASQLAKGS